MIRSLSVALLACMLWCGAAFAQVTGRFTVAGTNPNGSTYAGAVSVERTGDTFRIIWTIDGARFTGTGIGNDEGMAVSYRSGNSVGVALIAADEANRGNYIVVWTTLGGDQVGTERWTRR
jgi:hypothetical protein